MAKKVRGVDLKSFLNSSLKTALKTSDDTNWEITIDSISATIKILNECMALKFFNTKNLKDSPYDIFKERLLLHTGEYLIPATIEEENSIIIQVDYTIMT